MTEISRYEDLPVPAWALSYLVNADASGLDDAEVKRVDRWYSQFAEEAKKAG